MSATILFSFVLTSTLNLARGELAETRRARPFSATPPPASPAQEAPGSFPDLIDPYRSTTPQASTRLPSDCSFVPIRYGSASVSADIARAEQCSHPGYQKLNKLERAQYIRDAAAHILRAHQLDHGPNAYNPNLFVCLAYRESSFMPAAQNSRSRARGLGQILESTAADIFKRHINPSRLRESNPQTAPTRPQNRQTQQPTRTGSSSSNPIPGIQRSGTATNPQEVQLEGQFMGTQTPPRTRPPLVTVGPIRTQGFQDITDGTVFYQRMLHSPMAQLELTILILESKVREWRARVSPERQQDHDPTFVGLQFFLGSSCRHNLDYAHSILECQRCLNQHEGQIFESCLKVAKPNRCVMSEPYGWFGTCSSQRGPANHPPTCALPSSRERSGTGRSANPRPVNERR